MLQPAYSAQIRHFALDAIFLRGGNYRRFSSLQINLALVVFLAMSAFCNAKKIRTKKKMPSFMSISVRVEMVAKKKSDRNNFLSASGIKTVAFCL